MWVWVCVVVRERERERIKIMNVFFSEFYSGTNWLVKFPRKKDRMIFYYDKSPDPRRFLNDQNLMRINFVFK